MRLHVLTVTAFGPFAGTERVDFDALADGGLFLFTGATGAGKTSLLDAVCFALYGQVPGGRGGARGLRSDHAPEGVGARVVLEATLRGRRLRVTRSPQWERPKRRGSGTTTEPAKIHLEERLAAGWETRSTRLDETGHLVDHLIGLSLGQFCQVVLLPQGQFAQFLRSDAEARRQLLESLFDTARFTTAERWLVGRRQETARELAEVDQRIDQLLARAAEVAGSDPPDEAGAGWLRECLEHARSEGEVATANAGRAEREHDLASAALARVMEVAAAHDRHEVLTARRAELTSSAAEHDTASAVVAAARRVAPLVPMVRELARLQLELEEARAVATGTSHDLVDVLAATGTDGPERPARPRPDLVAAAARARRDEVVRLGELAAVEVEVTDLEQAIETRSRRVVELDDLLTRLVARLDAAPARRADLEGAIARSRAAVAALPGATATRDAAAIRLEGAQHRDHLRAARARALDEVRAATELAQTARSAWLDRRQARLDGMAAELAGGLRDGADCPVCGSREHPKPAARAPDAVSRMDEEAAAAALSVADAARTASGDALGALDVEIAAARATAGGDLGVDELSSAQDAAAEMLAAVSAEAGRAADAVEAMTAFAVEYDGWARQRISLDQDRATLLAGLRQDQARVVASRAALDDARGEDPSVGVRATRLARLADRLEALLHQVEGVDRLEHAVATALDRALTATAERGLASLDAVLAADRDEDDLRRLDEGRQAHTAELASVRDQLTEPALLAAASAPPPDLAAARDLEAQRQVERSAAAAALANAAKRVIALHRLAGLLDELTAARAPLADTHRTVDGLSRLAEGKSSDNRLRMSLSGYVLAARLEQVAASASERLARMSSGRYRLVHAAEAGSARARGGLHLRVLDAWTGVERDPSSLSGGETFSASLALALGLADVVTAEAGGTLLETLFVDEGFGSLDEESLDDVMAVLDDLREGGRAVGIVSHVADLRARIPVQLNVEKCRHGSVVRQ